jgi:aminoglycoside phosphotransferase (APT) family kinase protein
MTTARPYVDGPPGPPDLVTGVAERAAAHWGLPRPALLRVGMNGILTAGDVVIRVGRVTADPASAIALAELLGRHGVRVPAPARPDAFADGELTATAWERLVIVDAAPDWTAVGRMVAAVHELAIDEVPTGYPLPPAESFPWWDFDRLLAEVGDDVDQAARVGLVAAIDRHRGWSAGTDHVVCHGDVHPGNVVMTADGAVLLDWDLLCAAPPGWDHAMLLTLPLWGWPARWYDDFAAGYGRSLAGDPTTEAIAELRLVAATLMRLRAGRLDPAAMGEAQRRLAFWRGDTDAPTWLAQ